MFATDLPQTIHSQANQRPGTSRPARCSFRMSSGRASSVVRFPYWPRRPLPIPPIFRLPILPKSSADFHTDFEALVVPQGVDVSTHLNCRHTSEGRPPVLTDSNVATPSPRRISSASPIFAPDRLRLKRSRSCVRVTPAGPAASSRAAIFRTTASRLALTGGSLRGGVFDCGGVAEARSITGRVDGVGSIGTQPRRNASAENSAGTSAPCQPTTMLAPVGRVTRILQKNGQYIFMSGGPQPWSSVLCPAVVHSRPFPRGVIRRGDDLRHEIESGVRRAMLIAQISNVSGPAIATAAP